MTGNEKLKQRVHEALRAAGLDGKGIVVDVERRVAILRGVVDDARTKDAVERTVAALDGAAGMRSELRVKGDWGEERAPLKSEFADNPAAELARSQKYDPVP